MPQYSYENQETGEIKDIIQSIHDIHEYSENGVKWSRVWVSPQMGVDTKCDPYSSKDFVEKTGKKRGTFGQLLDYSKEMSERRSQKDGIDFKKEKYYNNYSKTRRGKLHPDVMNKRVTENLNKMGVEISNTPIKDGE